MYIALCLYIISTKLIHSFNASVALPNNVYRVLYNSLHSVLNEKNTGKVTNHKHYITEQSIKNI